MLVWIQGDSVTTYYTTALQGEILNAPLRVKVDRERAVLQALPDRLFLHFSRPMNQPTHSDQQLATHPLQRGKLSRALDRHGEFSASERVIAKAPYKVQSVHARHMPPSNGFALDFGRS